MKKTLFLISFFILSLFTLLSNPVHVSAQGECNNDGIQNNGEAGVDCGGGGCPPCGGCTGFCGDFADYSCWEYVSKDGINWTTNPIPANGGERVYFKTEVKALKNNPYDWYLRNDFFVNLLGYTNIGQNSDPNSGTYDPWWLNYGDCWGNPGLCEDFHRDDGWPTGTGETMTWSEILNPNPQTFKNRSRAIAQWTVPGGNYSFPGGCVPQNVPSLPGYNGGRCCWQDPESGGPTCITIAPTCGDDDPQPCNCDPSFRECGYYAEFNCNIVTVNISRPTPTPPPTLDCLNPVTAPLTYSPMEGPSTRVVFPPQPVDYEPPPLTGTVCTDPEAISAGFVTPLEGITCNTDPAFNCGQWSKVAWSSSFQIKDLESVFAKYASDYFEGEFQDTTLSHQQENLLTLTSSQWNEYNGPMQKLAPKILLNEDLSDLSGLRIKYIRYVLDPLKATRQEVDFTYTDINGEVPAPFTEPPTITQLVDEYGFPQPPPATPSEVWKNTWGLFWDKIPLAPNDKAWGKIGALNYQLRIDPNVPELFYSLGPVCALPDIPIVVPEYFRTNLTSAFLNQLLLPKIGQSPLASQTQSPSQSLAQGNSLGSACALHSPTAVSPPSQNAPANLLASSQSQSLAKPVAGQTEVGSSQSPPSGNSNSGSVNGEVLAALDLNHDPCTIPVADAGRGDRYCMPGQIPNPSLPDRLTVRPRPDICSTLPEDQRKWCVPCEPNDSRLICQQDAIFICGQKKCYLPDICAALPEDQRQWCVPCEWGDPRWWLCTPVCQIESGEDRVIDIPTSVVLGVPYLESIWNKSTSYRDNKQSGFLGFFSPPADSTGTLLNQAPYEKHGETPNLEYSSVGITNATYLPPNTNAAYPDFIAGVKNAENWVRQTLWPPETVGSEISARRCAANQPCLNNPLKTYNTYCLPDCESQTRTCWDSPSCEDVLINCNDVGGDSYCQTIPSGFCGSLGCTIERSCQEGGNCISKCNCL